LCLPAVIFLSLTYLLTPWCRVLLEKLTGLQLVKKFPAFHGTRRFITAFTSLRHPSLSCASQIQSIYQHPTSWRSILILSTHLRLGLSSGLFPSGFLTHTRHMPSPSHSLSPSKYINTINNPGICERITSMSCSLARKNILRISNSGVKISCSKEKGF